MSEVAQPCPTLCAPRDGGHQAPPSMGFSRQEYRSGLPFPSPGDLLDPGIEPGSPALQVDALPSEPPGNTPNSKPAPIQQGGEGPGAEAPPSSLAPPARSRRQAARCRLGHETGFQLVLQGASQAGSPAPSALDCSLFYSQATLGTDISL